jgi:hypothetical protein
VQSAHIIECSQAGAAEDTPGVIRQRAATLGSYTASSRTATALPSANLSGSSSKTQLVGDPTRTTASATVPPSYEAYAAGLRDAPPEELSGSTDSELKILLRHLTGLLVFPPSSAEVTLHPLFGPAEKPNRLR